MTRRLTDDLASRTLSGAVLLERGPDELVAVAGGATGISPDDGCTLGTRFQVASVSKQFTAAAVLLLADRGALSVTDPVCDWLDGCPPAWDRISVHHLLSNSAGLPHWHELPELDLTRPLDPDALLALLAAAPLLAPPGERYSYSSPGFVLLGRIIERVSGQSYASFLDQEFFGPLGLSATFSGSPGARGGLAAGRYDGAAVPSVELDTVSLGTGSIWSTVGDLTRWGRALSNDGLLSGVARQAMFSVQVPVLDDDGVIRTEGYGYGCFIATAAGRRMLYHPGDQPGFRSINAWFPDDDVRLAILSNDGAADLDPLIHDLIRVAFPEEA
jgi:CubicO group peptidase (beta-lactamase class C family)